MRVSVCGELCISLTLFMEHSSLVGALLTMGGVRLPRLSGERWPSLRRKSKDTLDVQVTLKMTFRA